MRRLLLMVVSIISINSSAAIVDQAKPRVSDIIDAIKISNQENPLECTRNKVQKRQTGY